MNRTYKSIFLLKSFATGLTMPILSLMVIARGVPMDKLALVVGIYSFTVVALEFPSGVFCDLAGRKRCFLISCVFMLVSMAVILIGRKGIWVLLTAFVIQGAGRAFASGSLDALVIEQSMELGGDGAVAKTSGELGILESVGIALGSIVGGALGTIGTVYSGNLVSIMVIYIIITVLVLGGVEENHGKKAAVKADSFWIQMGGSLSFSWKSLPIRVLMLAIFFTGILLFFVETYWQPGLHRLLGGEKNWLFGLVTFTGFGLTAASSQIGAKLLQTFAQKEGRAWWTCFFAAKMFFTAAVVLMWIWGHPAMFIGNYGVVYFLLGGGSVIENALLSKYTPDEKRASVMSLFSLVFQFGALTASAIAMGVVGLR